MSLVGKIFAVLAMIVAVFYTGVTIALVSLQENYRQHFVNEEAQHKRDNDDWKIKYANLESTRDKIAGERDSARKDRDRFQGENTSLQQVANEAENGLRLAMNIIDDQKEEIERTAKSLTDTHNDFLAKVRESKKLQDQITELKGTVATKNTTIDTLNQDLATWKKNAIHAEKDLAKVVRDLEYERGLVEAIRKQRPDVVYDAEKGVPLQPPKPVRGKVTAVDQKLGLVIINRGQRNDVRKGHRFIVFRGDKYIGRVIVDDVFPDVAAARYDAQAMKAPVEVGDDVTTKLRFEF